MKDQQEEGRHCPHQPPNQQQRPRRPPSMEEDDNTQKKTTKKKQKNSMMMQASNVNDHDDRLCLRSSNKRKGPLGRVRGSRTTRHSSLPSSPVLNWQLDSPWSSPSPEPFKEKNSYSSSSSSSSSSSTTSTSSFFASIVASMSSSATSSTSSTFFSSSSSSKDGTDLYDDDDPCNDSDSESAAAPYLTSASESNSYPMIPALRTRTTPSSSAVIKKDRLWNLMIAEWEEQEEPYENVAETKKNKKRMKQNMSLADGLPHRTDADASFRLMESKVRQLQKAVHEFNQALSSTNLKPYFGDVGGQLQELSRDAHSRLGEVSTFYQWLQLHNAPCAALGLGYFSILPEELNLYILSFLTVTDLACVQRVSRYWRRLAEDDQLWQRRHNERWGSKAHTILLRQMSFEGSGSTSDSGEDDDIVEVEPRRSKRKRRGWKDIYADAQRLDNNWRDGRYSTKLIKNRSSAQESAYCIKFDETRMITGSNDRCIRLIDVRSGEVLHSIAGHSAEVRAVDFDNTRMASGSRDRAVKVWDINTAQCITTMDQHAGPVKCMQMTDNIVMSGSEDATTKMLDLNSGKVVDTFKGHLWGVACLQFKDNYLVSGSRDRRIFVWDRRYNSSSLTTSDSRKCLMTLEGHANTVRCVAFDSENIISGSWDNTVKVWSATTGKLKSTLEGHDGRVLHLDFDRSKIVSGSVDKSVRVWWNYENKANSVSYSLHMHNAPIFYVTLNDYGITSASRDTELLRWDFNSPCIEDIKRTRRNRATDILQASALI